MFSGRTEPFRALEKLRTNTGSSRANTITLPCRGSLPIRDRTSRRMLPKITRNGRSGQEEREAGSCYHRISPGERTYWRLAGLWSCLGNLSKRKNLIWHEPLRGLHPVAVKLDPIAPAGLIKGSRPHPRQQVTIVDARVSNQDGAVDLSDPAVLAPLEQPDA